jgi:hypothetical protein
MPFGSPCAKESRKLTAYDWGESFVGLNLVLKPLVDQLFMKHLSDLALERGDYLLGQIFTRSTRTVSGASNGATLWFGWQLRTIH